MGGRDNMDGNMYPKKIYTQYSSLGNVRAILETLCNSKFDVQNNKNIEY